jgi:hypothetical protein
MGVYKANILLDGCVHLSLQTSLVLAAESAEQAKKELEEILSAYKNNYNASGDRLGDKLTKLCEENIWNFHGDDWMEEYSEVEMTHILSLKKCDTGEEEE